MSEEEDKDFNLLQLADEMSHKNWMYFKFLYNKKFKEAEERIKELEAALRPFAEKYLWPDDTGIGDELRMDEDWDEQKNDKSVEEYFIERGWIRAARAALGEKKDDH
jgi:hypothetical protein